MPPPVLNIAFCALSPRFLDVRVSQPVAAMRRLGVNVVLNEGRVAFLEGRPPGEARILIVQRGFMSREGWPRAVRDAMARDHLFVVEYDDHPASPFNAARRADSPDWDRFRMCHAVQCSTGPLRDLFLEWNPEVAVFENQIESVAPRSVRDGDAVNVFFGALNRRDAWQPLIAHLDRVFATTPRLRAVVVHDRAFFDAIGAADKVFVPACAHARYLALMHRCDICLLPLDDTPFNRCKSDIKFVEAAAGGLAVIASPVVYGDTIEHGVTGLIAHTAEDWAHHLATLAADPARRAMLGDDARRYVARERLLAHHVHARIGWYRDLWSRREALNAALLARAPELRR